MNKSKQILIYEFNGTLTFHPKVRSKRTGRLVQSKGSPNKPFGALNTKTCTATEIGNAVLAQLKYAER